MVPLAQSCPVTSGKGAVSEAIIARPCCEFQYQEVGREKRDWCVVRERVEVSLSEIFENAGVRAGS
jgi:hypothetical protein